jgi:hypothetical protein
MNPSGRIQNKKAVNLQKGGACFPHRRWLPRFFAATGLLAIATVVVTVVVPAVPAMTAGPDADVAAGARALPDRSFLTREPQGCNFYVDPSGSNASSGTQSAPWRTIGKAVATLGAGQVACVNSGTYDETGASAANSGTSSAPIVLKRTPGSPTRPVVRLVQDTPILRIDRGYWIVDGLELNLNDRITTGVVFGSSSHHITLRNSFVHDDAKGAAVYVAGDDVSIEGSEIANNFHYQGEDSHGVLVVASAERVLVRRNRIGNNGGDAVQCEYYGSPSDAQTPTNLTIEDNRIFTSPENEGRVEQGVDIKTCKYVSIRGSVPPDANDPNAAAQKFFGFKNSSSAAGGGGAMVIHYSARNVLVENNRMWDSCGGINIGRHDATYGTVEHVVVRRNVIFNMRALGGACNGRGILIQRVNFADLYHNTLDRVPGYAFRLGPNNETGSKDRDVDFYDNVVKDAGQFLDLARSKIDAFASDRNVFWSSDGNQRRFRIDGAQLVLSEWQGKADGTSVLVADPTSKVTDPAFIPGAGTTDDYLTQPSSPARDQAIDTTNAAVFGAGPDIGFRETYDDPTAGAPCQTATVDEAWPGESFSSQAGTFTATVDVTPLGAPIDTGVGLSQGTADAWTDMATIVRFNGSGNIDARNGTSYTADAPIPYSANVRYRVRLLVDVPARRYSAYVKPPTGSEITIGTNLNFRTEQQSVANLDHKTVWTAIGALQSCNFGLSKASPATAPTVAAAGDIACDPASGGFNGGNGTTTSCRQKYTSDLLVGPGVTAVLTLGDNQYESGTLSQFQNSYDLSWGRVKSMTHPAVGNHEYGTAGAAGYFDYFGPAAGDRTKGYYSFDIGSWHLIALNSNCAQVSGCGAGSPQERWLRSDLAAHQATCTLAYFHHARFSSGPHGNNSSVQPLWQALYEADADVVLSGHDHDYERFAPQDPAGNADSARGIREFVVGTGGKSHYALTARKANSELFNGDTYGVLKLTLRDGAYDWKFVPEAAGSFTDSGSDACH